MTSSVPAQRRPMGPKNHLREQSWGGYDEKPLVNLRRGTVKIAAEQDESGNPQSYALAECIECNQLRVLPPSHSIFFS